LITNQLGPQTRRFNTRSGILPSGNDSIFDPGQTGREFRFRGKPKQEEVKGDDLGNIVKIMFANMGPHRYVEL
jgi:hypothetical protein